MGMMKHRLEDIKYWADENKFFLIMFTLIAVVIIVTTILAVQPYCTTYEAHGYMYCRQLEWGGERIWRVPIGDLR